MDLSAAGARLAEHLRYQLQLLELDVLCIAQGLGHLLLDHRSERLRQEADLVVPVHHVAKLPAGESMNDRLNPWHQNLHDLLAASLRVDEGSTQLLNVLRGEFGDAFDHGGLQIPEHEGRSEAGDREARGATRHLVRTHLLEALHKQCLQLDEEARELRANLAESLEDSQQIERRSCVIQPLVQVLLKHREEVDGAGMHLVERVGEANDRLRLKVLELL